MSDRAMCLSLMTQIPIAFPMISAYQCIQRVRISWL